MGLFDFLLRLFIPAKKPGGSSERSAEPAEVSPHTDTRKQPPAAPMPKLRPRLVPLRRNLVRKPPCPPSTEVDGPAPPYRFANYGIRQGTFFDLSQDGNPERLAEFGLPIFSTPDELANWLELPCGQLAWLTGRFFESGLPRNEKQSHYHYRWLRKRSTGWRLIEAPKSTLRTIQRRVLSEILEKIPAHRAAHGFVKSRSIVTNAHPHVGQRVLLKMDLQNFYPSVNFARVVAIFRSVGYSREAATWLARLTTSRLAWNIPFPGGDSGAILPYLPAHLPQGAPTSPALANLSAYSLDVRLSGLARSFGGNYTRYADDLTFSGPEIFLRRLRVFIPLATKIIQSERFTVNRAKRKVIRNNQRQTVTGVVVNERVNVSRVEFDRLKAILTNCQRHGAISQNHNGVEDFAAHLRGRIAHVTHLNPRRGERLLQLYRHVDWNS